MDPQKEEKGALESLEQKLYDPKQKIDNIAFHHVRDRAEKELPTSWTEDAPIIKASDDHTGLSFGAKFLIGAFALLLLVLVFGAWRVLSSRNIVSEKNIDMVLDIAPYIEGGEATPLVVSLNNKNEVELTNASITLMYKQGTGAQDEQSKVQIKRDLGTVASGDFKREDFEVTLYGSEAEARDITVKLEYKVPGSNATFSKVAVSQVVLKSPPISVAITGPDTLSAGQMGNFDITVKNNTSATTTPSLLSLTLPTNFLIDEASPKPSTRGNLWQIGVLSPGESTVIRLTGSVSGSQGETATMRALVGSMGGSVSEVGVVYSSFSYDVKLRVSPLVVTLGLETDRGAGENLRYGDRSFISVTYKNTSGDTLRDVSLALKISGDAPLTKQVTTDYGYYNSVTGVITWDKASVADLANVPAGKEGTFSVTIPIVTKGTNAPKLSLSLNGKGTAKETDDVVSSISKSYTVQGSASISGQTHYKNSPFQNTGPIPPQANVDTTYTVHLNVSAQNALQNTKVSFVLPAYVAWRSVGDINRVAYDAKTRTVTWTIGSLEAGKSTATDIGLSVRPSQIHVNSSPSITGSVVLDADEIESRAHLRTTISGFTTFITGETWQVNPSVVVDH